MSALTGGPDPCGYRTSSCPDSVRQPPRRYRLLIPAPLQSAALTHHPSELRELPPATSCATIEKLWGARKGVKGKSGASPARSRHCKRRVVPRHHWGESPGKVGSARLGIACPKSRVRRPSSERKRRKPPRGTDGRSGNHFLWAGGRFRSALCVPCGILPVRVYFS